MAGSFGRPLLLLLLPHTPSRAPHAPSPNLGPLHVGLDPLSQPTTTTLGESGLDWRSSDALIGESLRSETRPLEAWHRRRQGASVVGM